MKPGSIVKAYVLFRKKDKGMALTLNKAKAKELRKEVRESKPEKGNKTTEETGETLPNTIEGYFPTVEEVEEIKDKFKSIIKISQDKANLGKVLNFRVIESKPLYYIVKSLDAEKKSKNIVAILPKALTGKFF